jgi:Spherulation-specific family 4
MRSIFVKAALVLTGSISAWAGDLNILLPLYSYPNWYAGAAAYQWDDVAAAASQVGITAIINPNSGPDGGPPNSDFIHGMGDLSAAGVAMIGYVHTSYGNTLLRPLLDVQHDIDLYELHFSTYGVSGIFLDEVSNDPAKESYYSALYSYIKSKPHLGKVITNPGANVPESFITAPTADTTVIFENTSGWPGYTVSPYLPNYSANHFASLMLNVPTIAQMHSAVDLAVQRNVGYVYVTDDAILAPPNDNPFDRLPTYWQNEVSYIASVPEPSSALLLGSAALVCGTLRRRRAARMD